jgi:hypothetical protein
MPQHEHLDRIGAFAAHHKNNDQLQHLSTNQVPERHDHDRQYAASRRSLSGQTRTSAPVTGFPNGTRPPAATRNTSMTSTSDDNPVPCAALRSRTPPRRRVNPAV